MQFYTVASALHWRKRDIMVTRDIRLERIDKEYGSLRKSQTKLFDKVDSCKENDLDFAQVAQDMRRLLREERELLLENREMLLAIIQHLEVPYEPKPMGFVKD